MKITYKNISWSSPTCIIKGFNLEATPGAPVVLTGPSGSGKSTLLQMVMRFTKPDSGEILIDGVPLSPATIDTVRKNTGWVPQGSPFLSGKWKHRKEYLQIKNFLTEKVSENLAFNLESLGLGLNDQTELENLSGGEKQKLLLALALCTGRSLLLFDEPTTALDTRSQNKLYKLLTNHQSKTMISISHDPRWVAFCKKNIRVVNHARR